MIQKRTAGQSGVAIPVLSMGGHAFIWETTPDAAIGKAVDAALAKISIEPTK